MHSLCSFLRNTFDLNEKKNIQYQFEYFNNINSKNDAVNICSKTFLNLGRIIVANCLATVVAYHQKIHTSTHIRTPHVHAHTQRF